MVRVYDGRMAAQGSPGRAIYDAIKVGSPNGLCPLCGQRVVATLDHYLPKSRYAALAVNPANLIPACSDCNKAKSNAVDDTLHPYYDNIENELWLRAELKEIRPASVSFLVDPPASWTPVFADRVTRHFRVFGLNRLYAVHAAQNISGMQWRLSRLADAAGAPRRSARIWRMRRRAGVPSTSIAGRWRCTTAWRGATGSARAASGSRTTRRAGRTGCRRPGGGRR